MSDQPLADLPGLRRWGDQLREATERAERAPGPARPRRGGRRRSGRGRGTAAALLALVLVLVALGRVLSLPT